MKKFLACVAALALTAYIGYGCGAKRLTYDTTADGGRTFHIAP